MTAFNLTNTIQQLLSRSEINVFDELLNQMAKYHSRDASGMLELRARDDKKKKGDVWELFCAAYYSAKYPDAEVWLHHQIPDDLRTQLKLTKVDNGIDIVCRQDNQFIAIQCKYRAKIKSKVPWNSLSTFVGLCAVTGPWSKHIVMTNCVGITRKIPRTEKDKSMCYGTFAGTKRELWMKLSGNYVEHTLMVSGSIKPKNTEELRERRLKYFETISST